MKDLEETFRVNATGPAALSQALLPNLRAGSRRTIVNLSSGLGSVSENDSGGWIAYRVSKAALNQLTRSIAADLKSERFVCVSLSPGWCEPTWAARAPASLLRRATPPCSGSSTA
jgi:NAD(P)-dependent dehydrogenase (short-subunit alcohol dehydrogenase family)